LLIIVKTTSDYFNTNERYAQVIGVKLATLNAMEREVLCDALDFEVIIDFEEYVRFACLVQKVGTAEGSPDQTTPASPSKRPQISKQSKAISKSAKGDRRESVSSKTGAERKRSVHKNSN
jgi:hypothetical protein